MGGGRGAGGINKKERIHAHGRECVTAVGGALGEVEEGMGG